ncbi:MAG: DUF4190 domain-containing protein [bacterium]|nr:DUF4190 domain-containing protein [bacterium]
MAVASLILGILGLSGWVILLGIISGTLTALPGLILGIIALRKKRGKKGMAIAGIIVFWGSIPRRLRRGERSKIDTKCRRLVVVIPRRLRRGECH